MTPAQTAPKTNMGLTLPKNFEEYPEEVKQAIVDHEIAKERQQDLQAIDCRPRDRKGTTTRPSSH
jgi:hypothetical protein